MKIYYALKDSKKKILFVKPDDGLESQEQIVEAFDLPQYVFLVIIWHKTTDILLTLEMCRKLKDLLQKYTYKKIILVSENSELVRQIGFNDICYYDKCVTFADLSKTTQDNLLRKNINFQGQDITLEDILKPQTIEDFAMDLKAEMLEKLVREEKIAVGMWPLDNDIVPYYVDRRFKRKHNDVEDGNISNKKGEDFRKNSIYYAKEKVVLVTDDAGMGKSTALAKLAAERKEADPHLWVIKINLSDYAKVFRDSLKNREVSVMDLLNSQETTKLTSDIERFIFSIKGKIVLMMDGVDEVSPDYTDLILDLLIQCQSSPNFLKIFVTTRPNVTEKIETILKVKSFELLPFSKEDQKDFLKMYWVHTLELRSEVEKDKCMRYAKTLVNKTYGWAKLYRHRENHFIAIPLQARMLAEIFEEGCKKFISMNEKIPQFPEKFNIAELYDVLIEKERKIFIGRENPSAIPGTDNLLKAKFDECLDCYRSLALQIILSKMESDLFLNCHRDCSRMEDYLVKSGIVIKSGDKFQFRHRSFAEYFVALSIRKELECRNSNVEFQRFLIDEVLLKSEFETIRDFLDSILQKVEDSLPRDIFQNYQSTYECNLHYWKPNENLIFILCKEGHLTILKLILNAINFKSIKDKQINIKAWQNNESNRINTLVALASLTRKGGLNIREKNGETPLHHAVGHLHMVKFLVERGANVTIKGREGHTALHLAAEKNELDTIKYFMEADVDFSVKYDYDSTVLHSAAQFGNLKTIKYLLSDARVDINAKDSKERTALHLAAAKGELETVKYLMQLDIDVNVKDDYGRTALHSAANFGHLYTVKFLFENGVDLDIKDGGGRTALHSAAAKGKLKTVKYLIENGADINVRDDHGCTVLHLAARNGYLNSVKYFLEAGIEVNVKDGDGRTALHLAAGKGELATVEHLVKYGIDVNIRNNDDHTAWHFAANKGEWQIAQYLQESGIKLRSNDCQAALHSTPEEDALDIVQHVVEYGGVDVRDNNGRTALHLAAWFGKLDTIKHLVELGAGINVKDSYGRTALHIAANRGKLDIVRYLVERGVHVDTKNDTGRTALHLAAAEGNLRTVKLLMELDADVAATDEDGLTALSLAVLRRQWDTVNYLQPLSKENIQF